MNESKRRGRPPKAAIEGADALVLPVRDYWPANTDPSLPPSEWQQQADAAQAYALRVWNGQSPNVPRNERIKRVMAALAGQNLPTEGVNLP